MRNTANVTGGKLIPVFLQSISDISAVNPLVAFYDIHGSLKYTKLVQQKMHGASAARALLPKLRSINPILQS
jgi:hypothetical protein